MRAYKFFLLFGLRCDILITGDGTHNKKQRKITEGRTPIIKNITVTDENGNITGSTYPKRALGLVKKGRARWINADTICLCARNMEDKDMANNLYEIIDNQMSKIQRQTENMESGDAAQTQEKILEALTKLREEERRSAVVDLVREQLDFLKNDLAKTADLNFSALDDAGTSFASRETTKQRMLDVMEQLIHGTLAPNTPTPPKCGSAAAVSDNTAAQTHGVQNNSEEISKQLSDKTNGEVNSAFNKTE